MMDIAVNCLEQEARRKLVCESILAKERSSRAPQPRSNTVRPSFRTSTARPGVLAVASEEKKASRVGAIWSCEDCAADGTTTKIKSRESEHSRILQNTN